MKQRMMEKKVRSALPIYIAAGAFLLCAMVLPVYRLLGIVVAAAVTAAVFVIAEKRVPPRVVLVPVPVTAFNTGDQQLDVELTQAVDNVDALAQLNERIPDEKLSADIARMERAGTAILEQVRKEPRKGRSIRKFVSYYLPTSVKLLTTYADLTASGAQGENARNMVREIQTNAGIIATAFETQLDALFAQKALDVSADITVLDGMMKGDGLAGAAIHADAATVAPRVSDMVAQDIAAGAAPGVSTAAGQAAQTAPQDSMKPHLTL